VDAEAAEDGRGEGADAYTNILLLLRTHSGVDFTLYKPTTIQRRVARRLLVNKQSTLHEYVSFLRGNAEELDALYSDVLISVTSFFRNPETFDILERRMLPEILAQRGDAPLRFWVLGCSTGQEAYSIAMAFVEAAEKASRMRKLQVFATDLNEAMLEKARHGLYAKSLVADITPQRPARFGLTGSWWWTTRRISSRWSQTFSRGTATRPLRSRAGRPRCEPSARSVPRW
jgi:two-component system CheB/CheR fusion protein